MANDDTNIQDDDATLNQDDTLTDPSAEPESSSTNDPQAASAVAHTAPMFGRSAAGTIKVGS